MELTKATVVTAMSIIENTKEKLVILRLHNGDNPLEFEMELQQLDEVLDTLKLARQKLVEES